MQLPVPVKHKVSNKTVSTLSDFVLNISPEESYSQVKEKMSYCISINASSAFASSLAASIPHFYSHLLLSFSSTLCITKVTYLPFPQTNYEDLALWIPVY